MTSEAVEMFMAAADAWVCDGYALDIRYLADSQSLVWDVAINLMPLAPGMDLRFEIEVGDLRVGHIQSYPESKALLMNVLQAATEGAVPMANCRLPSPGQALDYFSFLGNRDQWFWQLDLQVSGIRRAQPSSIELARFDNLLRKSSPPFGGVADVSSWLGLHAPGGSNLPMIRVVVGPPADVLLDQSSLRDDRLHLTIRAVLGLDVSRLTVMVRIAPGAGMESRFLVEQSISWHAGDSHRDGRVTIPVKNADQVLVAIMLGDSTVRRHWFVDPAKARNNRLLAIQHFDQDLRRIRHAVFEATDKEKFESGIAALLFLHGFSPAVQLETEAPDIVVATPGGRLAVVECTTRISDFASKVGKLADRKVSLAKAMIASGHPAEVMAVLICRLPPDQIATQHSQLLSHKIVLLTEDHLRAAFNTVRGPRDPDKLLEEAVAQVQGAGRPA